MTRDDVARRVHEIVAGVAGADRTPANPGPDTPLGAEGFWLDSVELLEVIIACEQEFTIELFGEGEDASAQLRTVETLAEAIHARLAPAGRD